MDTSPFLQLNAKSLPLGVALISHGKFKPDILTMYFEEIRQRTTFKKWFFGHYHENMNVNANEILLYEQIIRSS